MPLCGRSRGGLLITSMVSNHLFGQLSPGFVAQASMAGCGLLRAHIEPQEQTSLALCESGIGCRAYANSSL